MRTYIAAVSSAPHFSCSVCSSGLLTLASVRLPCDATGRTGLVTGDAIGLENGLPRSPPAGAGDVLGRAAMGRARGTTLRELVGATSGSTCPRHLACLLVWV